MVMSLARSHFEKTKAKELSVAAEAQGLDRTEGNTADQVLARLRGHEILLKGIRSKKNKIIKKREFLPEYEAYVEGVMASETGLQDAVLPTIMVWRLDCADLVGALEVAAYVIEHDLKLPERFKRSVPTLFLEELADLTEQVKPTEQLSLSYIDAIEEALELTNNADIPDEVHAKVYKQLGYLLEDRKPNESLNWLKQALEYDPKSGVKTKIASLEKSIAKAKEGDDDTQGNT